ncbi:MAG: phosphate/sulfate permease [Microbacterium sp.]|nr:phosphate/sulfate permease [Microbacterium sp.]
MTFPAWVIVFVVIGVFLDDVIGGLRTGALFGAVMAGLGSIPPGRGGGSVSSSNYVDSGFASDASCGDSGGGGDGSHC